MAVALELNALVGAYNDSRQKQYEQSIQYLWSEASTIILQMEPVFDSH